MKLNSIKPKAFMLKNALVKNLIFVASLLSLLFTSQVSFAVVEGELLLPDIPENTVKLSIVEPGRDLGYTVGDVLKRVITVQVKKPYSLVKTSLPIVGYERRYKGKVVGIDVSAIKFAESEQNDTYTYIIDVDYQVLTNNVVAKPAALPAEVLHFKISDAKGKSSIVQYRIPSWSFRVSPLAVFGSVKVEQDMSSLRGPLILDSSRHILKRNIALGVLGVALLGLLYILGNLAWLPRMGAPFSKTLRDMRKYPNTPAGIQQSVSRMHVAINATANQTIFKDSIDELISKKPAFTALKDDFTVFFEISRHAFFESSPNPNNEAHNIAWLKAFARRCRDCERGLSPDTANKKSAGN